MQGERERRTVAYVVRPGLTLHMQVGIGLLVLWRSATVHTHGINR